VGNCAGVRKIRGKGKMLGVNKGRKDTNKKCMERERD
jgi:hypothetical protein